MVSGTIHSVATLSATTALLLIILFVLFVVPGWLILKSVTNYFPQTEKTKTFISERIFLIAPGIGGLVVAAVTMGLIGVGVSISVVAWILRILFAYSLAAWFHFGGRRELCSSRYFQPLVLICVVTWTAASFASFPSGRLEDVRADKIQYLLGLPVDNLIPYNTSRYLVEGISPKNIEVVPTWQVTDRGPLAGILGASLFLLLGLSEEAHWLTTSPGLFFVFEVMICALNALAILSLWEVAGNKKGAVAAIVLLFTSYFFWVNIVFGWPKFFATYYAIVGLILFRSSLKTEEPSSLLFFGSGIMLGAAMLSHDGAVFVLATAAVWWGLVTIRSVYETGYESLKRYLFLPLGSTVVLLPWWSYQRLSGLPQSRMGLLHLFCIYEKDISSLTFLAAASSYFKNNSLLDIVSTKIGNIFYPLMLQDSGVCFDNGVALLRIASCGAHLSFFQFIFAIGAPSLAILIWQLVKNGSSREPLVWAALASVVPAALVFGCARSTANHHWAYSAFIVAIALIGVGMARGGWVVRALFAFATLTQSLQLVVGLPLSSIDQSAFVYANGTAPYFYLLGTSFTFLILLCLYCAYQNCQESVDI